jgi:hypothetical protein
MTYVPICDFDGHFWPKKKHLFYVAVGSGGDFSRYRRRFCSHHVESIQEDLAEHELVTVDGAVRSDYGHMADCFSCGEPVKEGGRQVFITGYPTQDERKDYWGRLHESHQLPEYLQDTMVP